MDKDEAQKKIREAVEDGRIGFLCSICKASIEDPDPVAAVVLIKNWNGPEDGQRMAQWFAHEACAMKVLG